MPFYVWLLIFHPVPLTIVVFALVAWFIVAKGYWKKYKRGILIGAVVLYAVDTAFALPHIIYAWRIPDSTVVHRQVPLPASLVLVNARCEKECHARLLSGELTEVILVETAQSTAPPPRPPTRYKVGWVRPGSCPQERRRAIGFDARDLLRDGFCPVLEPTEIPSEGIFVVFEHFLVTANYKAAPFTPAYLLDGPPGRVITFTAVEVQHRTPERVEVLAERRKYFAPGLVGLPPLIGCWARPDNVIWIMPPGDTGCGLWRWFTSGGDQRWHDHGAAWVYAGAPFTRPERPLTPPHRPDLPPATSAEALDILSRASPVADYLPALKEALLAPSVSDDALADLVVQRARRRPLEGRLVALLATERPAAALVIPARLGEAPADIREPALILSEMEQNRAMFDAWADFMFDALSSNWWRSDISQRVGADVERFLGLVHARSPGFLCRRLDRITRDDGVLARRDKMIAKRSSNYFEATPEFLPHVITAAVTQCGEQGTDLLRNVLASPAAIRRERVAELVAKLPAEIAARVGEQAFGNLLDDRGMDYAAYKADNRRLGYLSAHVRVLQHADQSCDKIEHRLEAAIAEARATGKEPSPYVIERLTYLRPEHSSTWSLCGRRPSQ